MKEVILVFVLLYLLFSFLTMNAQIIKCYVDNTITLTLKKGILAFIILFLLVILGSCTGRTGWLMFFILCFVYVIYPSIIILETS